MKKSNLNFIISILMLTCMSAIAGIGFLMRYILIPGQDRWVKYGRNVGLYTFGMDRHEWGTIHLILGFVLLGLLLLHIILYWKVIINLYDKILQGEMVKKIIAVLFIVICALLIFGPLFISPEIVESERGHGRGMHNSSNGNKTNNDSTLKTLKHANPDIVVKGFMTIEQVSTKYNIPTEFIKTKLNIPKTISDKQTFRSLKETYSFTMNSVEKIINDYHDGEK